MSKIKQFKSNHPLLFINIIFLVFAVPYFLYLCIFRNNNVLYGDDIFHHLSRFQGIIDGLKDGQFPVYIYPNTFNATSTACPTFYPDFFIFPFALLGFLNIPTPILLYIYMFSCMIATLNVFYALVNKILKSQRMVNIAILLLFTSTYFVAVYFKRCALGELTAFIFVLLLALAIYNMLYEEFSKPWLLLFSFIGLLLSHTISMVLCTIVFAFVIIFNAKKLLTKKSFYIKSLSIFVIFIFTTFFYTGPFIEMFISDDFMVFTNPLFYIENHTLSLKKLFTEIVTPVFSMIPLLFNLIPNKTSNSLVFSKSEYYKSWAVRISLIIFISYLPLFTWEFFSKILSHLTLRYLILSQNVIKLF